MNKACIRDLNINHVSSKKSEISPLCVEKLANNQRSNRYLFLGFLPSANHLRNISDLSDCVSATDQWSVINAGVPASMDHRALLNTPHGMIVLGGMAEKQTVIDRIIYYPNPDIENTIRAQALSTNLKNA